jgi:hypothetical protein
MAQALPPNLPPPADPAAARLQAILAALPDDWILLRQRRIGGPDGPEVGYVLLHPAVGIALVDVLPRRPGAAFERLRELLAAAHLTREADTLPVVSAALAPDDISSVGERLAAAFRLEPSCAMADAAWPQRALHLLLGAEDWALARRGEAQQKPEGLVAEDHAILSTPFQRHLSLAAILAASIAVSAGIGAAAGSLLSQQPPEATRPIAASSPAAVAAPPQAAASAAAAEALMQPPPLAAAPVPVAVVPMPHAPPDHAAAPPPLPAHQAPDDLAVIAKDSPKYATKHVAGLAHDARSTADADGAYAPPPQQQAHIAPQQPRGVASADLPPINASDLPPLDGSLPSTSDLSNPPLQPPPDAEATGSPILLVPPGTAQAPLGGIARQ